MRILVIAEHDGETIRSGTRSAIGFANSVAEQTNGAGHRPRTLKGGHPTALALQSVQPAPSALPAVANCSKLLPQ